MFHFYLGLIPSFCNATIEVNFIAIYIVTVIKSKLHHCLFVKLYIVWCNQRYLLLQHSVALFLQVIFSPPVLTSRGPVAQNWDKRIEPGYLAYPGSVNPQSEAEYVAT